METAISLLEDCHMLRAFAAKGANAAIDRLRRETGGHASRTEVEIAYESAMEAVKAMAEGDAALAIMREERDRYKALALDAVNLAPRPLIIPAELHSTHEPR